MHEVAVIAAKAAPIGRYAAQARESLAPGFEADRLGDVTTASLQTADVDPAAVDALILPGPAPGLAQGGLANFMSSRLGIQCSSQLTEVSNLGLSGSQAFDLAATEIMLGRAQYAVAAGVDISSGVTYRNSPAAPFAAVSDVDFEA